MSRLRVASLVTLVTAIVNVVAAPALANVAFPLNAAVLTPVPNR